MKRSPVPALGSPPPAAAPRRPGLRVVLIILWAVAAIQMIAGLALMVNAPKEVDALIQAKLDEMRVSLYEVKAVPDEERAQFDQRLGTLVWHVRLWHGCNVLSGLVTAGCALMVRRDPRKATLLALGAFVVISAAATFFHPNWLLPALTVRVVLMNALIYAAAVAFAQSKAANNISQPAT